MILVTAATQIEMDPLTPLVKDQVNVQCHITGVGPVETAFRLTKHFCETEDLPDLVINFGIAGAYFNNEDNNLDVLDVCLATKETFGDFGVALENSILPFNQQLGGEVEFESDTMLIERAVLALKEKGVSVITGSFITVNSATGTRKRGEQLSEQYRGICENMEGAAVARVCQYYKVPFIEVRSISNMVEDRNPANWKMNDSIQNAAQAASILIKSL